MRWQAGDVFLIKKNPAAGGRIEPRNQIKKRGFARPVRADDRIDGTWSDCKAQFINRNNAAKAFGYILDPDQTHLRLACMN